MRLTVVLPEPDFHKLEDLRRASHENNRSLIVRELIRAAWEELEDIIYIYEWLKWANP